MFEIGFSEILIIAVIALLVLGPEKLPKAARFAGLWMRRARAQWYSVKSEFERELAQDELRRSLAEPLTAMASDMDGQMRALGDAARAPFEDAARLPSDARAPETLAAATGHDPQPTAPMQDPLPAPVHDPQPTAPVDPPPATPGDPAAPVPRDPEPATPRDPAAPPA
jgi:sec-independent protein translocase protein TatB